jgi:hypothetical protein
MAEPVTLDDIKLELLTIERQMKGLDGWNLHDRWKSGRLLIALRSPDTKYLPKGQLTTAAATLKTSTRELSDRMRVADVYPTDAAFKKAARGRTWTDLLKSLPPTREARTGSTRPARNHLQIVLKSLPYLIVDKRFEAEGLRLLRKTYDYLLDHGETDADSTPGRKERHHDAR